MLCAHRLRRFEFCLGRLFRAVEPTSALSTSTHRSHAASSSRLHDTSHAVRASEQRDRQEVVVFATEQVHRHCGSPGKHRKARKACPARSLRRKDQAELSQAGGTEHPRRRRRTPEHSGPVIGGPLPPEALDIERSRRPAVEPIAPVKNEPPVEEPKPPSKNRSHRWKNPSAC